MMTHPREGQTVLNGRYSILRWIQASTGEGVQRIGKSGRCRFCGCTDPEQFRTVAHTFPEAIGNRWVVSRDECDKCNQAFSKYDDALAIALRPFLTLGGISGKSGVPQTGRSAGNSVIRHDRTEGKRSISIELKGFSPQNLFQASPDGRYVKYEIPVENFKFRPRHAYKALSKIGLSLLPVDLLPQYSRLLDWLQKPDDQLDFPVLEVGLSFGSVGNAPKTVSAVLLQRVESADPIPHIYLIFCAGSVCAQLALMSDHLEDQLPPVPMGAISVNWSMVIGRTQEIHINYGKVWPFNWRLSRQLLSPSKNSYSTSIFLPEPVDLLRCFILHA